MPYKKTHNINNHIDHINENNNNYVKKWSRTGMVKVQGDKTNKSGKTTIWKLIKFRDKSDKPFNTSTIIKKINKRSS